MRCPSTPKIPRGWWVWCTTRTKACDSSKTLFGVLLVTTTLFIATHFMGVTQPLIERWMGQPCPRPASPCSLRSTHKEAWMVLRNCTPHINIGFLKTHKCASTTIQNILFRYGHKHNLHFALPDEGSYFGGGRLNFKAKMVRKSPLNKLEPNIFAIHTKWDHDEVRKVMPEDTVYFTIVREPLTVFQSLFVYGNLKKRSGLSLEEFVEKVPVDAKRNLGQWGYNQMAWDFGMSEEQINNLTVVREMVLRAENQFGLVLVAERMEESLVLLAHYLCWNLSDVLVLHLNSLKDQLKQPLSPKASHLLQQKLSSDYVVYRHFAEKFERHVEAFGLDRMAAEVARLQELKALLVNTCGFRKQDRSKLKGELRPWSPQVEGFQLAGSESEGASLEAGRCLSYTLTGLPYVNLLRERQRKKVIERFGPIKTTKPQGPGKKGKNKKKQKKDR